MGVKKVSMNSKGSYAIYKNLGSFLKNKKRKLARHIDRNPNDAAAAIALTEVQSATPRKAPIRSKARLDVWCLPDSKGNFIHNRSMNNLSGRLSAYGKFVQEATAFSKRCANRLLNDPKRVLRLHTAPVALSDVWDGWADFVNDNNKQTKQTITKKKTKT